MIGPEAENQVENHEGTAVLSHEDTIHELLGNGTKENQSANEPATQVSNPVAPAGALEENSNPGETVNQHAEAGRKGAQRIHQLIQQGRQYEREHGLMPGRQRLRQLIQEGKLFEQEHGLKSDSKKSRSPRRTRISQEQVLKTLLQSLLRMVKPAYRDRIQDLLQALEGETP